MHLHGVGAVTAVGLSAPASYAALRARIVRLRETSYTDTDLEPVIGAPIAAIRSKALGVERLSDLAGPALRECLARAAVSSAERVALFLGTQEPVRPAPPGFLPQSLLQALAGALPCSVSAHSAVIPEGAASALIALARSRELLAQRAVDCCIVGGVDSLLNIQTIRWLESSKRLKTDGNSDGLHPGEAAVFTAWRGVPAGRSPGLRLLSVGRATEAAHVASSMPNMALGLTAAMRDSLKSAGVGPEQIGLQISDVTGERYSFLERAAAVARVFTMSGPNTPHWHPVSSLGVTGAAAGACLLGWASAAGERGYLPGPCVMCSSSSDEGARVTAIVRYDSPESPGA
jgi:3-oxoacyl-[acyl-carrier-protein] synthase-1